MTANTIFQIDMSLAYVAWALCIARYVWPRLRAIDRVEALCAIATLHSFRFFGLVFLLTGFVGPGLPRAFATPTAYGDLTTALESGSSRVQLEAYGGAPGDKSSDARRLSLKRALAVRQLLIDNGVPSNRIDVRAMGGIDDKGPTDRVDVFLRAG